MDQYDEWCKQNIGKGRQPEHKVLLKHLELYRAGQTAGSPEIFHGSMLASCINLAAELAVPLSATRTELNYTIWAATAVIGLSLVTPLVKVNFENIAEVIMLDVYQTSFYGPQLVRLMEAAVQHEAVWKPLRGALVTSITRMASFLGLGNLLVRNDKRTLLRVLNACEKKYYEIRASEVPGWVLERARLRSDGITAADI